MNRWTRVALAGVATALFAICLPALAETAELVSETSLRSSPESAEIAAFLTPAAPVEVVERREGWVRVRVEGWVRADAIEVSAAEAAAVPPPVRIAPPAASAPPPAPATPPPAEIDTPPASAETTPAPPSGTQVEGLLRMKLGRFKTVSTAGVPVMLLPAQSDVGEAVLDPEDQARMEDLDAQAARLKREAEKAMRGSNFTEAARKRDELMERRAEVLSDRQDLLAALHGRNEQAARATAVAGATTDSKGWFGINVAPGSYKLYARLTTDKLDLEWVEPVTVGAVPERVELDTSNARGLPAESD